MAIVCADGRVYPSMPIKFANHTLEKSDLRHKVRKGSFTFYGFHSSGMNYVIAIQETSWAVALLKPFYSSIMLFWNSKPTPNDFHIAYEQSTGPQEFFANADKISNREERLAEFFERPSIRRLRRRMCKGFGDRNAELYIAAFKEYYDS